MAAHDEATEISWERWISEWEQFVYPAFRRHGISKDAALVAYSINTMSNEVCATMEPPTDEWGQGR